MVQMFSLEPSVNNDSSDLQTMQKECTVNSDLRTDDQKAKSNQLPTQPARDNSDVHANLHIINGDGQLVDNDFSDHYGYILDKVFLLIIFIIGYKLVYISH